jgi:Pentapeptide repeats (8 copies)
MNGEAVPPTGVSETAFGRSSYESLATLRQAHLLLKRSISQAAERPGFSGATEQIRAFLMDARKTGTFLADTKERRAAQGILDYWSAELASTPDAKDSCAPVLLEPFEQGRRRGEGDDSAVADKSDQRALIRWSAFAREWNASNKDHGYLLTGEAIQQAARFRAFDPGINDLVTASEDAEAKRTRRARYLMITGASIFAVLVCVTGLVGWQFWYLKRTSEAKINDLKSGKIEQTKALKWLDRYQSWLPPYELSGIQDLEGVTLPDLRLHAPNFATVSFRKVSLKNALLTGASFNESRFSFDGSSEPNDFSGASLRQAQFRGAKIAFTSFAGADLYRAVFDRAVLCDVDFSGANLRSASFWAVSLHGQTKEHFKSTAWWLAEGWPWSEIEKLAPPRPTAANPLKVSDEDKARTDRLKQSTGFKDDIRIPADLLKRAASGTLEQALALNDIAWTLAIWGIDVARPQPRDRPPSDTASCSAERMPTNARDAAEQAVCIVKKLNSEGEGKGTYTALLSNFRDTLAYVLMEEGELVEALRKYDEILKEDSKFLEAGEVLFRYAVAQYVAGQDKATAVTSFKTAIGERGYQPTHELQTLKDHIFTNTELRDPLKTSIEKRWPPVPNQTACPAAKSATK